MQSMTFLNRRVLFLFLSELGGWGEKTSNEDDTMVTKICQETCQGLKELRQGKPTHLELGGVCARAHTHTHALKHKHAGGESVGKRTINVKVKSENSYGLWIEGFPSQAFRSL